MKITYLISAVLAATAAASPTRVLEKRETTWCSSYGSLETGGYTIYHNNWGAAEATSGSQCTTFDSVTSGSVVWSTSWTWAGGSSSVKSYSNVALVDVNTQLSAISSIPSKWEWTYTGSDIVADVSYDLWLAPSASSDNTYEIMVWLAAYGGAGPISSTGSPVDTPTIAGSDWNLYSGTNGDTTVFSFVATSTIASFDGDINEFFTYLTENQGVSSSLYATSLQAGTEPFTGSDAVFKTSAYSISVDTSDSGSSSGSESSVSSVASAVSVTSIIQATSAVQATSAIQVTSAIQATSVASSPSVSLATPVTLTTFATSASSVPLVGSNTPATVEIHPTSSNPGNPPSSTTPTSIPHGGKKCHS